MTSPAFEVRELSKRYGRRGVEALRGITLAGAAGEVFGLLGPNGAGKTTTVKCLTGLVQPTAGQALLLGQDARLPAARARLGYLPERAAYPAHLTGPELLEREGRIFGLARPERRGRLGLLLERVGLSDAVFTRRIGTYSKGERARLGLALALMGDPRVVLLDEPTDGLDPVGRRAVRELLRELAGEGRAVLLNSHLLAEVEACCDRVAILKEGRLVAQGTPDELRARQRITCRIRLARPPAPPVLEALRPVVQEVTAAGERLTVSLAALNEIDVVVDLLRAHAASIRELHPLASLEDLFMELVGEPHDDPAPAATPEAAARG